jgi:hypothetical protein
MGWKSTVDITRKEAIKLIFTRMADVHTMSDYDLGQMLETLGYGEDMNLPYYGHDFLIIDKEDPCDYCHQKGTEYCTYLCKEGKE